ncbi:MAG: HU family DNA-binding protein [Gemmobacter sp.]|jgi:Bacterial DNA-binding protein
MATKVSDAVPAAKKKRPAGSAPAGAGDALKLKALVDQVTATTGGKKKDVRAAVAATLQALGEALSAGQELNLPPLGKAKVSRKIDTAKGGVLVVRLRRNAGDADDEKDVSEGVAAAGE